jgi:hypothetical protein
MNKEKQRELKQLYKETKTPAGVFLVRNKANGKIFVASAMNVPGKINGVRFELELGSYRKAGLQRDWKELGQEGFEFEILETLDQEKIQPNLLRDELKELERKWLEKLQPYDEKGYN